VVGCYSGFAFASRRYQPGFAPSNSTTGATIRVENIIMRSEGGPPPGVFLNNQALQAQLRWQTPLVGRQWRVWCGVLVVATTMVVGGGV